MTWLMWSLELLEVQRPVVHRRRQAEAVVDQRLLAGAVAVVHAAHLRHRDVRLVDEQQPVVREVVEQRPRRAAGARAGRGGASSSRCRSSSRPRASSRGRSACALRAAPPRGCACLAKLRQALVQLRLDVVDRLLELVLRRDEVLGREDVDGVARSASSSPVSGSISMMRSTSSPKKSMRTASSS